MKNLIDIKKEIPSFFSHTRNAFFPLQQEINRVFNDLYNTFETSFLPIDNLIIHPSINIVEDDDSFKVEVEMPGMGMEDIEVSVNDKILSISGKKTISKKNKDKDYVTKEISYGSYQRNINLPEYVDTDKVSATFKKGMLWVNFPKKAGSSKRRQRIKIEEAL